MARTRTKILLAATSLLALGACGDRKVFSSWYNEAGAEIDEGGFGNPTMNNVGIHNGDLSYVMNLNARFNREVPTVVEFAFNSSQIDNAARLALDAQARWIAQFPEVRFRVYGHTDLVGSQAYNKSLGLRRANAVVNYLVSRGISRSRLEAMVSFGETQPIIYTEQPEMRNRRAVTEVTGFVKNHPLVLNGKYAEVIFREYVDSATEIPTGGSVEADF
ncbi:OmpA family protein [Psychromarinibacter halotolerans]|uniref:OmpA family protein n=1 Tax=Psychromarinibacter halotolerans TaxID=1775175 RepID=A0ABV7GYQ5_9RHOB|nr:OmpA family protein [Psychromarinibacter halotolerans]MDF0596134.1 OmpA family protein [Psychromarinibacter halotolerans]